jgi:hypothetical protein
MMGHVGETPPGNYLSPEALQVTRAAMAANQRPDGTYNAQQIALELGIARSTAQGRILAVLRNDARKGEMGFSPVLPGFSIKQISTSTKTGDAWVKQTIEPGDVFDPPEGHVVKGVSALVDADGRVTAKWIKTTSDNSVDPTAFAAALETAFSDFKPAADPVALPNLDFSDHLTLYPWADPHFGLMVWGKETGGVNWDLRTACRTFRSVFSNLISRVHPTNKAILVVGGDALHADNNLNMTPTSKHPLQVDGRYEKVHLAACETIAEVAHMLLGKHAELEIIVLEGNHDETSAATVAHFLYAWFRNEPRVKVDISPNKFRFRIFGSNMLGFHHGHTADAKEMDRAMAAYAPEMWGKTKFRVAHTFHRHTNQLIRSSRGGCTTEVHEILAPADVYAHDHVFVSGRSLQSIIYSPSAGECGRLIENL